MVCTYCAKIGHDHKTCPIFMADLKESRMQEDKVGEWVRANQIGERVETRGESGPNRGRRTNGEQKLRKKKPMPECLVESFSSLRVKEPLRNHDDRNTHSTNM
ncbi:hypothetical protein AAHE18_15G043300 [Arachis hypogaea]